MFKEKNMFTGLVKSDFIFLVNEIHLYALVIFTECLKNKNIKLLLEENKVHIYFQLMSH